MKKLIVLFLLLVNFSSQSQDCVGGAINTNEAFLYGRFETSMRSVGESGVVSSFFLYNYDLGCNWPAENNEIDIEMTGNSEDILFTTHYPGPWYYTDVFDPSFNPHDAMHDYAIEWEPGIVRWFIDGTLVNVQDQPFVADLIYPMRIFMNLWVSDIEDWVGPWDPAVMPVTSQYDYVRYYAYTPGAGNYGTNNNFTLDWDDDFTGFDGDRWTIGEFGELSGNLCSIESTSLEFINGYLYLFLEEAQSNIPDVPVTISADLRDTILSPTDIIYVNGTFNDWCGNCAPMTNNNGIWSTTIYMPPGIYEYVFAVNIWERTGKPPLGSVCDYYPCDNFNNYGVLVPHNSAPIELPSYCWNECEECDIITSTESPEEISEKKLIKIVDLLGRDLEPVPNRLLLYLYDDGSFEKRIWLK